MVRKVTDYAYCLVATDGGEEGLGKDASQAGPDLLCELIVLPASLPSVVGAHCHVMYSMTIKHMHVLCRTKIVIS